MHRTLFNQSPILEQINAAMNDLLHMYFHLVRDVFQGKFLQAALVGRKVSAHVVAIL